ncbi:DUF2314 domain-containing protein [Aliikangiella sp. G2MR2-5]|uniref:DUF2314 domain-containing protein n=1 Tax=Aliikangiella sp. G2MR2-5 TaxID=2788943 RepID=UPI0018AA2E0D|nr:DUF2314 domain-containing protein [Aliikangiella sp. G2MR2-5]
MTIRDYGTKIAVSIVSILIISILIVSAPASLVAKNNESKENKEHPGIFLRHIIYFKDLATAEKIIRNTDANKFFNRVDEFPDVAVSPVYNQKLIKDVSINFPVPDINYLSYFGRGMSDEEKGKVQDYQVAVLYDFLFPLSVREKSLFNVSQLMLEIADKYSGYIWDSETRELFAASEWKKYRIDSWSGDVPNVKLNTVIHAYQVGDGFRAITLGMAKFGLPDLVINGFEWNDNYSISSLINLTSQQIAEQGLNEFNFKLDIRSLKDSNFKKTLVDSLYENASESVSVKLKEAKPEEGDPDNFLLEFDFSQYEGKSLFQKQDTLLSSLFGWKDEVAYIKHNAMIEAASEAARQKLPELKSRFNAGLEVGEQLSLKAPFKTRSGENEWMWVEVVSWKEGVVKGILRNVPRDIPTLNRGDEVTIFQNDVFDYIFYNKDGTSQGNKTGELIQKFQRR